MAVTVYLAPSTDDLAVFLGIDPETLDVNRAQMMISDAEDLALSVVTPLPVGAGVVIKRIAGRAYTNVSSMHTAHLGDASISFAPPSNPTAVGGMYLTRSDKADLRRLNNAGNAFTIDPVPDTALADLPPWDIDSAGATLRSS